MSNPEIVATLLQYLGTRPDICLVIGSNDAVGWRPAITFAVAALLFLSPWPQSMAQNILGLSTSLQAGLPRLGGGGLVGEHPGLPPLQFPPREAGHDFLGDAGSHFLGFTLAALAVLGAWAENNCVDLAAPLLIFGVFIYDMLHITVERVVSGKVNNFRKWIEYVGRDHLHHRLEEVLGRRQYAVLFIYALSLSLGVGVTVLLMASPHSALLLIAQAIVILFMVTILEPRGRRKL